MKLTLIFVVAMTSFWCEVQSGMFYCGRGLSNRVLKVCEDHLEQKRDAGWWMSADALRPLSGVRGKRGIVDECCYKTCTVKEVIPYCYS
ncbi:unnamed protein product [Spodoptera littoralis]|uniref:Insulin-like domain-containing protein n=1 Tax=Spodoptera littoralis TaxID=7109 RepID=A0A9P0IBT2_SPOLI|nr:unnamed protein product [Spodoptera littoralis]CAH1642976.1 unnamed protein product [Spodoptera littoralis]